MEGLKLLQTMLVSAFLLSGIVAFWAIVSAVFRQAYSDDKTEVFYCNTCGCAQVRNEECLATGRCFDCHCRLQDRQQIEPRQSRVS
jgi:hypothetical protein